MDVYVENRRIILDPKKIIGSGGEAEIFNIGGGKALKLFKPPDHPDFQNSLREKIGAEERLAIHQEKLKNFPRDLPERIIAPEELATDKSGRKIIGYAMRLIDGEVLLRYADKIFRQKGAPNDLVIKIFRDLQKTVDETHKKNVVIGDFNDLNVLVVGEAAYLIDADSFQFGKFLCSVFNQKFVDPLLCDPNGQESVLTKPHTANSDWYGFAVMLFNCLLFVDPYGGIYKPKNLSKKILHNARPLHRITVFNQEVKYPKPAIPYIILPDDILQFFFKTFEKDLRGAFPKNLIENIVWQKCSSCGIEHARSLCPVCFQAPQSAVKETTVVKGKITVTKFFKTKGLILFATAEEGKLRWLYHEDGKFFRENGVFVAEGELNPFLRFRISGDTTLIGKNGQIAIFSPEKSPEKISVDSFGSLPIFDANENYRYWINNGQLLRDGKFAPEYIGNALEGQTLFWVGPFFGFGFYRAGNLNVAFVFDANNRGINDQIKIPPIKGQLIDSTCFFSKNYCWFFTSVNDGGKKINRCSVINFDGSLAATAESSFGDITWLGSIRGKCAIGNILLSPTDEGIMKLEVNGRDIVKSAEFPETDNIVDEESRLFAGPDCLFIVDAKEIKSLKIIP